MSSTETTRRRVLLAAVPLTALGFWPTAVDPYFAAKLLVLVACAATIVAMVLRDLLAGERPRRWSGPTAIVIGVLGAALVYATVTSPDPWFSVWGVRSRFGGLLPWASLLTLCVAMASLATTDLALKLGKVLAISGVVVGLIGVAEMLGLVTPPAVDGRFGATLGNTNFAAAFLGICVPAGVVLGLRGQGSERIGWYLAAGFAAAMSAVTGAFQGPLVIAVSGFVLALWLTSRLPAERRRAAVLGLVLVAALGGSLTAAGFAGTGPLEGFARPGAVARVLFWRSAIEMTLDNPVTGVGLDRYVRESRTYLPAEYAGDLRLTQAIDRAHSVPLQLAATGGLPLLGAYLAFVGASGVAFVVLARREDGKDRDAVMLMGATWVAYQTQSVVSLDLGPLPIIHMLTAGWLLARWRPPAPEPEPAVLAKTGKRGGAGKGKGRTGASTRGRGKGKAAAPTSDAQTVLRPVGSALAFLLVIGAIAVGSLPLQAESRLLEAERARAAGDIETAQLAYTAAAERASWEPEPHHRNGVMYHDRQRLEEASAAYERAIDRPGGFFSSAVSLGRASSSLGRIDRAADAYLLAAEIEPHHPVLLREIMRFFDENGDDERALEFAQRLLEVAPDDEEAQEIVEDLG